MRGESQKVDVTDPEVMYGMFVTRLCRTDEVRVLDVCHVKQPLEICRHLIAEHLWIHGFQVCCLLDLKTVLIGASRELNASSQHLMPSTRYVSN